MSARFQELDWQETPMGAISLRRRVDPLLRREVYEIKLGDEYLMSSAFTTAETAMADLALARLEGTGFDVLVGGLGLGYTAQRALEDDRVGSVDVVEFHAQVIDWHLQGLIPSGAGAAADPRCRFVHGDFFALVGARGDAAPRLERRYDAVLADIDHSPEHLLDAGHAGFYRAEGLRRLAEDVLRPGGAFALWSDDPPEEAFTARLAATFTDVRAETVEFANPLLEDGTSANTVYLATAPSPAGGA